VRSHNVTHALVVHGELIQIACDTNYELQYAQTPMCTNGSWSSVPACVPCLLADLFYARTRILFDSTLPQMADHN
jgi:hypothetical protein